MKLPNTKQHKIELMDAYWRAAYYLVVGQIYLLANPLLQKPFNIAEIKSRLLGHWGTTPSLNFIYLHINNIIQQYDLNMIFVIGPEHGGPAIVANTYLEGTYSEFYPEIKQDEAGLAKLFKQLSFPRDIPSHTFAAPPNSINEGGELGYAIFHVHGAVFDNPDLIACCVAGDDEAETEPMVTAWHGFQEEGTTTMPFDMVVLNLQGSSR